MMTPSTSKIKLTSILPPKTAGQIFEAQPMRSILSTRPISAYVSNSTIPKQHQKSKALYDFSDQIQDLREKEVNLEKAKADFWLAAENQRHTQALADLQRQHETQNILIKQQHESQLKIIQKENLQECQKLETRCEILQKQASDSNQADIEAFKAQIDYLKQDHSLQLHNQNQKHEQKTLQIQAEMREQLEQCRREVEAQFKLKLKQAKVIQRQKLQQHVSGIVSKLSDEHFEALKKMKDDLKNTQEENARLAFEFRDLQTRNRRQEDYIFELRQSLTETQSELKSLKLPQVQSEKGLTEICTQTFLQTYNKQTDIEGLVPIVLPTQELQTVLTNEELQEVIQYQHKVIQKLTEQAEDSRLQQERFFAASKSKVLRILRQSHTQLQSCRKQLLQEQLQYDELAYMLAMLQPKPKNTQLVIKDE